MAFGTGTAAGRLGEHVEGPPGGGVGARVEQPAGGATEDEKDQHRAGAERVMPTAETIDSLGRGKKTSSAEARGARERLVEPHDDLLQRRNRAARRPRAGRVVERVRNCGPSRSSMPSGRLLRRRASLSRTCRRRRRRRRTRSGKRRRWVNPLDTQRQPAAVAIASTRRRSSLRRANRRSSSCCTLNASTSSAATDARPGLADSALDGLVQRLARPPCRGRGQAGRGEVRLDPVLAGGRVRSGVRRPAGGLVPAPQRCSR